MNKLISKVIVVCAFVSCSTFALAKSDQRSPSLIQMQSKSDSCEICPLEECPCVLPAVMKEPCICAYNAPARIDPACGWDMWVLAEFIYYQPKERGLSIGRHFSLEPNKKSLKIINMDFDFHPGFKIGAGTCLPRDNWTLYFEYSRLKTSDSHSVNIEDSLGSYETGDILMSNWNGSSDLVTGYYLKGSWEFNYNSFILELGRPFYLGKKIICKPSLGLTAGWLDQKFQVLAKSLVDDNSQNSYSKNSEKSHFIGPRICLNTDWLLNCNFRLFGSIAGSLAYQQFEVKHNFSIPIQPGVTSSKSTNKRNNENLLTPIFETSLGVAYGRYLSNNKYYLDLSVGYDFNYLDNQNLMRWLATQSIYPYDDIDDVYEGLMLQGFHVSVKFDF